MSPPLVVKGLDEKEEEVEEEEWDRVRGSRAHCGSV